MGACGAAGALPTMARAPKLSAHCCWVCSTCPFGQVKPDCGGQGWRDGRTKRGLVSVVGHVTRAVTAGASKHGLLFEPRGLLDDKDELDALAWGIIDEVLPTRVGMEVDLGDPRTTPQGKNVLSACGSKIERLIGGARKPVYGYSAFMSQFSTAESE